MPPIVYDFTPCSGCPTSRYTLLPDDLIQLDGPFWSLSLPAQHVYLALRTYTRRGRGPVWPSNEKLARHIQASVRTVQRGLRELQAAGIIVVIARRPRTVHFEGEPQQDPQLHPDLFTPAPEPVPVGPPPEPMFLPSPPTDARLPMLIDAGVLPPLALRTLEKRPDLGPEQVAALVDKARRTGRDPAAWLVWALGSGMVPDQAIIRTPTVYHRAPDDTPSDAASATDGARAMLEPRLDELRAIDPDLHEAALRSQRMRGIRKDSVIGRRILIEIMEGELIGQGRLPARASTLAGILSDPVAAGPPAR